MAVPLDVGTLPPRVSTRLARLLGEEVRHSVRARGGYTAAARWVVTLQSGRRVFAKMGTNGMTADALRREWSIYTRLRAPFLPEAFAWADNAEQPLLVLEDWSDAYWPPPWDRALVEEVHQALQRLAATTSARPRGAFYSWTGTVPA